MNSKNWAVRIMFLSQTSIGILGNFSLFYSYLALYYNQRTLKPTELILMHLITVNSMIILCKGLPNTMASFGVKLFFNDLGYQIFLYILRVSRSMSIGIICLLSVFQAIIISPRDSCWKNLKVKAAKYIGLSISLLWILYMVVNFIFPVYVYTKLSRKNTTKGTDFVPYTTVGYDKITSSLYAAFFVVPEILFSVLMVWSGTVMVVTLYRHKQHVKHIRSSRVFHRTSPESRATQNILALVSTFLAFYTLSSILHGYSALADHDNWCLMNITAIISMGFPTFGPFVLMNRDFSVSRVP